MAAYGDWQTLCPLTFTAATLAASFPDSTEAPWTVLSEWGPTASGISGFNVIIPEMDKVVMVFKGFYGWEQMNMTAMNINTVLNLGCANCTAHAGAVTAYLEAKAATNDWADVAAAVNATGHQWSMTGHGFAGMVSQVAALDLGWRGLSHWSHNHGSPRVFNPASAAVFDSLYAGEAGQRCVANNDSVPTIIPESADYTFTLQGFHVYGTNVTYGQNYDVCGSSATDPNCLGGTNITDHEFYYTPIGFCGGSRVAYNESEQDAFLASESSSFYATATSTFTPVTTTTTPSSTVPSSTPSSAVVTVLSTAAPTTASATAADAGTSASVSSKPTSSAGKMVVERTVVALLIVAIGVTVLV